MRDPRPAAPADIPELIRLRVVMLTSLGRDPGPEDAAWRSIAAGWFRERLARPEEWAFRVVGPEGGPLQACGAGWLTEHVPGPRAPTGQRGYIGLMCTEPDARRQGHARRVLAELIDWFTPRGVTRLELQASPAGQALYRSAGFVEDEGSAMYRSVGAVESD
jgi:GNAT superfamily N-acetyltransferase